MLVIKTWFAFLNKFNILHYVLKQITDRYVIFDDVTYFREEAKKCHEKLGALNKESTAVADEIEELELKNNKCVKYGDNSGDHI